MKYFLLKLYQIPLNFSSRTEERHVFSTNYFTRNHSFLSLLQFQDVIDILIVAFVIYQVIRLMKETRAAQLVKGIIILVVVLQLSSWLHLNVLQYILENTLQLGFMALIVIFQPELRRALEEVGRSRFGQLFEGDIPTHIEENDRTIEEIIRAAGILSMNKTGALIVMERNTKLGEIIKTGISIRSDISAELLLNIFIPNTALHDGAVIIRGDSLMAAACFLPLSQNAFLSKELGTRHRAAVGMSENSDAVILVVSEETGKISLAINGSLARNLTTDNLRRALYKTLKPNGSTKTSRNKLLFWKGKKHEKVN